MPDPVSDAEYVRQTPAGSWALSDAAVADVMRASFQADLKEDEHLAQCECWWTTGYYAERVEPGEHCPVHTTDDRA